MYGKLRTTARTNIKIKASTLPSTLLHKINSPDPADGEDIIIEDSNGRIIDVKFSQTLTSFC
jgi:hypothetical protein